jgi:rubrerythrin
MRMFSIKEILELGLKLEQNGEMFYREALKKFSNPSLRVLLEWLAREEVKHGEWFIEKLKRENQQGVDAALDEIASRILKEILGDQSFSLKEADFSKIERVEDLIEIAVEFEKDTILFFEMIQSMIEDEQTLMELHEITEEERHHIELLQECEQKEILLERSI